MNRLTRRLSVLGLATLFTTGCAGYYYAEAEPPAAQVEVRVGSPGPEYFWLDGYWRWSSRQYMWVPGHWERTRPHRTYEQGRWERHSGHWRWRQGHWRK